MVKDYKALLTITEFPQTKRGKEQLCNWLEKTIASIWVAKPDEYAKQVRFRLMKEQPRKRKKV